MKKVFAIIMSAMMLVCFMPTMAFADGSAKTWEQNGKFKVGLASGATTAVAEVYDDYSVAATVKGNTVDASSVTVSASMKNVESLKVGTQRDYEKEFKTPLTQGSEIPLAQWFPHIFGNDTTKAFEGTTITGQVDGKDFGYNVSAFTQSGNAAEYKLTATPTDVEKVRAAWHAITANVDATTADNNSKIEIPKGAYMQVAGEKLVFDVSDCVVDPSSQNNGAGTVQAIKDAATLYSNTTNPEAVAPAKANFEMYVPKGSVVQLSSSLAKLNRGMYVRSNIEFSDNVLTILRTAANKGLPETVVSLIKVVDGVVAYADDETVTVDILSAYDVTINNETPTTYAYGDTFTLPAADAGYKWVDKKNNDATVKAGDIKVTGDMELAQVKDGGAGGGGFVVIPVETPLDKAKTEANTAISAAASANKYDEAEQAEVKSILDKAAADIKNAKTEEEVKAIQETAQAELDKVLTTEEKAQINAVKSIDKEIFKAKSKYSKLKGKRAIKLTWNVPKGMKFDGFEVYRSTKKFSGYGKTPYFTTTKTSYINSKGLVKGKTYYYKVRAFVIINGEKVYTDYSTKAFRKIK